MRITKRKLQSIISENLGLYEGVGESYDFSTSMGRDIFYNPDSASFSENPSSQTERVLTVKPKNTPHDGEYTLKTDQNTYTVGERAISKLDATLGGGGSGGSTPSNSGSGGQSSGSSGSSRQSASRSSAAKTWDSYVRKTNASAGDNLGAKVRDGWQDVCEKDSKIGDGSFKSWVKWYNTSRKDAALMATAGKRKGQHLSPEEVLKLYQGLVLMTPELEGIKIDAGYTQEEADKISDDMAKSMETASPEEKKSIKEKAAAFAKGITSKFPKIKFRSPIVVEKPGSKKTKSEKGETRQAAKKNMTVEEAKRSAENYIAKQSQPELHAIGVGASKSEADRKAQSNALNKIGKQVDQNTRLTDFSGGIRFPLRVEAKDGTVISVCKLSPNAVNEAANLSRGALYRRRYYGRY